jgi:hypothetical protein
MYIVVKPMSLAQPNIAGGAAKYSKNAGSKKAKAKHAALFIPMWAKKYSGEAVAAGMELKLSIKPSKAYIARCNEGRDDLLEMSKTTKIGEAIAESLEGNGRFASVWKAKADKMDFNANLAAAKNAIESGKFSKRKKSK